MKFYSEKLNKLFDTPEELQAAETPKKKKKAVTEPVVTEESATVPSRKELASAVESADEKVKQAYADYETAKAKVEELSKKYLEEINAILDPAQEAVKEAERLRYEAVRNFNDNYGAYKVTVTGSRAAEDMIKAISNINAHATNMFRDMFWI